LIPQRTAGIDRERDEMPDGRLFQKGHRSADAVAFFALKKQIKKMKQINSELFCFWVYRKIKTRYHICSPLRNFFFPMRSTTSLCLFIYFEG
jgi:hypothetical protein